MMRHGDPPINRPVTPSKRKNEKVPPGGSNFAGNYHKKAFAAYTYPKEGAQRLEMRDFEEARGNNKPCEGLTHSVAVLYHVQKEETKPSRLRMNFDHRKANREWQNPPAWEMRAERMMRESQSSPALAQSASAPAAPAPAEAPKSASLAKSTGAPSQGGLSNTQAESTLGDPDSALEEKEVTAAMLNPNFNPHPCLTRGTMKLSKGRARDWGVDLDAAPGFVCPYYEAPKDRLLVKKEDEKAEPRVLEKSRRWSTEDVWAKDEVHATYKVTQVDGPGYSPLATMKGGRDSFIGVRKPRSASAANASQLFGGFGKSEQPPETINATRLMEGYGAPQ